MKSLRPHLYRYVPKYFVKKYPKYVSLMENFLIFLETKNSLNFFDGTTERDHSIYNNIIDFDKHAQIDNLPVKNKDILNAYFEEYATTLDFRNQVLSFDEETMRMLAKFSGMVFNTKSSWSSYNLLFAIISTYLFNGAERGVVFKSFFNEDFTFDTEDAPDFYDIITVSDITKFSYSDFIKNATGSYGFVKLIDTIASQIYVDTYNGTFTTGDSLFNLAGVLLVAGITVDNSDSIGRNEIILSEYPLYKINIGFDGVEVDKNVITGKGTRPFEYQLISKSDLFVSGNFVSKLKSGFNPAGFKNEIIYVPEDIECETYYDSKIFTKVKFDVETYEEPDILMIIDGIGTIYLIGEFEEGVDYYATPEGEITTDITGIYLGVGNSDGDIDLDIIEYAVEITSPLDSADIALDVPFTFEATTNVQDGRTLHIVAYQGELTVVLDELTISGGAISGSVAVSESDGFTIGAVQLLAWYSPVVSTIDTVDVTANEATITGLATDPASPEPATNFVFSGDSTYLVGEELTLQYSTDDATWLPLGVATVQGDGTWSKDDCQIADAGDYDLRAIIDGAVESEVLEVTVESAVPENVIFVAVGASGANDGTSWDNAYTDLQTAINSASAGQEVWVKQGTYYPSVAVGGTGAERDKAFYLKTGVAVYGGFTGSDYIFVNRNYTTYETICNANGNYHCFHFKDKNCDRTAILDGFTVRGANGDQITDNRHRGGGFAFPTEQSHPTIRNCKITANYSIYGSAIRNYTTGSPLFENCQIYNNNGDYAITVDYLTAPADKKFTLLNCSIYNTTLVNQRCIQNWDGNFDGILIEGCLFYNWGNFPVINLMRSESTATRDNIINKCIFRDCYMALKLQRSSSSAAKNKVYNTLIRNCTYALEGTANASDYWNCTLTANTYALYNWNSVNAGDLANCIIYGNTNMFARAGYNNFTFSYSDCQTAQSGTGNISSNPNWDVNYNLNAGSPCLDVGDNTKVYGSYDLNGNTRIVNTTVDMGCYERQ